MVKQNRIAFFDANALSVVLFMYANATATATSRYLVVDFLWKERLK